MRPESEDWEVVRELEARLKSGHHLPTAEEIATVRRAAAQVGLLEGEVQLALEGERGLTDLVIEIRRRIREGSQRLMRAFTQAQRLLDQGEAPGAKAVLESVLSEEQIPFYRESVEEQMRNLGLR
jgi:DUSAM domain-containing protein